MRHGRGWVLGLLVLGLAGCDRSVPTETESPDVPEPEVVPPGTGGGGGIVCPAGARCVRLFGSVREDYSDQPIEGALVAIVGAGGVSELRTAADGSFDTGFNIPADEQVEVQVSKLGHSSYTAPISTQFSRTILARLVSDSIVAADIIGTVQVGPTWDPYVPLAGAMARLRAGLNNYDGPVMDSVIVDASGNYRFAQVPPGPISVSIDAPGYSSARFTGEHSKRRPVPRASLLVEAPVGEYEFELRWQDTSHDLDLRVWTPSTGWLSYTNPGRCDGEPWICLVSDDRTGQTGERFRVTRHVDAHYLVNVVSYTDIRARNFANSTLRASGARLVVREGSTIKFETAVPTTGSGALWNALRAIGRDVEAVGNLSAMYLEYPDKQQ